MTVLYFLIVSVLHNGVPVNVDGVLEFEYLNECQYAGALFVQQIASPGYRVSVECVAKEVNDA